MMSTAAANHCVTRLIQAAHSSSPWTNLGSLLFETGYSINARSKIRLCVAVKNFHMPSSLVPPYLSTRFVMPETGRNSSAAEQWRSRMLLKRPARAYHRCLSSVLEWGESPYASDEL